MKSYIRKQTPRVVDGRVQKNNTAESPAHPRSSPAGLPRIIRLRPGPGFRHVLLKSDIERFVALLPDWETLSEGLHEIILAEGDPDAYGMYDDEGRIEINALPVGLRAYA